MMDWDTEKLGKQHSVRRLELNSPQRLLDEPQLFRLSTFRRVLLLQFKA